jgi:hypothetical protein
MPPLESRRASFAGLGRGMRRVITESSSLSYVTLSTPSGQRFHFGDVEQMRHQASPNLGAPAAEEELKSKRGSGPKDGLQ